MMPLTLASAEEENIILRINGKKEVKEYLENLGITVGTSVRVMNTIGGNIIVITGDSRIAISKEMAQSIMV